MRRLQNSVGISALLLLVAGCGEQPLLFDSVNMVGVDISVSGTSSNPLTLSLGYKSNDATMVPVSLIDKNGAYHPIRGCYTAAVGGGQAGSCVQPSDGADTNKGGQGNAARTGFTIKRDDLQPRLIRAAAGPKITEKALPVPPPATIMVAPPAPAKTLVLPVVTPGDQSPGSGGAQTESMNDSLSVFSSFNATASASASAGADVGLGKVFATGIAAQQLTEGQNYLLQYKGQSLVYSAALCLANLAKAMGDGKAQSTDVQVCTPGGAKPASAGGGTPSTP